MSSFNISSLSIVMMHISHVWSNMSQLLIFTYLGDRDKAALKASGYSLIDLFLIHYVGVAHSCKDDCGSRGLGLRKRPFWPGATITAVSSDQPPCGNRRSQKKVSGGNCSSSGAATRGPVSKTTTFCMRSHQVDRYNSCSRIFQELDCEES